MDLPWSLVREIEVIYLYREVRLSGCDLPWKLRNRGSGNDYISAIRQDSPTMIYPRASTDRGSDTDYISALLLVSPYVIYPRASTDRGSDNDYIYVPYLRTSICDLP